MAVVGLSSDIKQLVCAGDTEDIEVIKVAASYTDTVRNRLVDTPLLKLSSSFDHPCFCLAFRPGIIERWTMDL